MKCFFYLLSLAFFLTLSTSSFAQVKYFVQAGGNMSIMPKLKNSGQYVDEFANNPNYSIIKTSTSFKAKPGFSFGGGAAFKLTEHVFIEALLGLTVINYRQKNNIFIERVEGVNHSGYRGTYYNAGLTYPDYRVQSAEWFYASEIGENEAPKSLQKKQGNLNLGLLTIGGLAKLNVTPKTSIGIGPSANIAIWAKTYNERIVVYAQSPSGQMFMRAPLTRKTSITNDFTPVNINANLQVAHQLTEKISALASFTQAINKLYKRQEMTLNGSVARMRYISLGVRYYLN